MFLRLMIYGIQIIFVILVLCIVSKRINKNGGSNYKNGRQNTNDAYGSRGYIQGNTKGSPKGGMYGNMQRNPVRSPAGNMQGGRGGSPSGKKIRGDRAGRNGSGQKSGGSKGAGSTTEYLERKAMEDQREHMAEKMEEQRRVSAKYGNMPAAGRHILGDSLPAGMEIVCCEYCGAENEVKTGYRKGLCCYFCRTEL